MSADDTALLLELARETLMREVLPLLPEERRREALMVASAVGIAARSLAGKAPEVDAASLAAAIRAGRYDAPGAAREEVRATLWALARHALRVDNPKLLAAHGLE